MTETELILGALRGPAVLKKDKKKLVELFPDPIPDVDPVISSLCKKVKKKKVKKLESWTNTDFLRHLESSLKQEGMVLETTSLRDRDLMAKIYDDLADQLSDEMSNKVLKNYLDWWVSDCSRFMRSQLIYPAMLRSDKFISRFLLEFHNLKILKDIKPSGSDLSLNETSNADTLYSLGGLLTVLMSKGIVVAYHVLLKNGEDRIINRVSDALVELDKSSLIKCLDITMKVRYNKAEIVDFMSIAQPALKFHDVKQFIKIDYKEFFV